MNSILIFFIFLIKKKSRDKSHKVTKFHVFVLNPIRGLGFRGKGLFYKIHLYIRKKVTLFLMR